jgi:hypothetical protein
MGWAPGKAHHHNGAHSSQEDHYEHNDQGAAHSLTLVAAAEIPCFSGGAERHHLRFGQHFRRAGS